MDDEDNVMRSIDMSDTKSVNILRDSIKELEEKVSINDPYSHSL
jgi:hypothetical protein